MIKQDIIHMEPCKYSGYHCDYIYHQCMTMRLNEKIEDNKGVIRRRKSKMNIQYNGQKKKRTNEQTTIYKTLHWKQKIE